MRRFHSIKPWIRWPGQPSVRCRSSWTSRKLDFAPSSKKPSADQNGPKAAAKAQKAPVASLDDARRVLKEKFGHDAFRPEQENVVSQILAGRNVVMRWPQHSGRSTAYLSAALAEIEGPSRHGLIVVVSPSAAHLMHGAEALKLRGIAAAHLAGLGPDLTVHEERMKISAAVRSGKLRVLYLQPQFLQDHTLISAIGDKQGGLHMLAIDETEASSDDHNFGGGLFNVLNDFTAKVQPRKIVILERHVTGEADPRKYIDVGEIFTSRLPWLPHMNVQLRILANEPGPGYTTVRNVLKESPVPTLIYTTKYKGQSDLADHLQRSGFDAQALVPDETTREMLDAFSESKLPILIASGIMSALVDKPDLRQIIFTTLPGNIEMFDLLCRVAGRDGEPSTCVVVFDPRQEFRDSNLARAVPPSFAAVRQLLPDLFHRGTIRHPAGPLSFMADGRQHLTLDFDAAELSFAYSLLEFSLGFIKSLGRQYAACEFDIVPGHESVLKTDRTPTGVAVVKHSVQVSETGLFDFDIVRAAHKEGLPDFMELTAKMNNLQRHGHVKVYPRKSLLIFRLEQVPKPGAETEAIAKWVYEQILKKHEARSQKRRQLRDVLLGNVCILAAMAKHFGSQLPDGKARCGRCSFCLDGRQAKIRTFSPETVNLDDIKTILAEIPDRDSPRFLARVAIGVYSPRVRHRGLHRHPLFGSMANCRFEDVLEVFAGVCGVPVEEA